MGNKGSTKVIRLNIQPVNCLNIKAMYKRSWSHPLLAETHKYSGLAARAASLISKLAEINTSAVHSAAPRRIWLHRRLQSCDPSGGEPRSQRDRDPPCPLALQVPGGLQWGNSALPRFKLTATSLGESAIGDKIQRQGFMTANTICVLFAAL